MSDFEYECTGTNASDEDNISYDFNISDNDYNYDSEEDILEQCKKNIDSYD